jgi:hypothetical protein
VPVRPLIEDDIPQVADLYWTVLRGRKLPVPPAVRNNLRELYFTNPWIDSAIPSLVYDAGGGKVVGFLGVIPRKMSVCGQPIRVAFGGNFVVDPQSRNLAGMHLLGTYMAGEQDLSQTDSANDVSRALLKRLGFRTILPFSIHWLRVLRPGQYVVHAVSRLVGPVAAASVNFAARPFCSVVDSIAAKPSSSPFHQGKPQLHDAEVDVETLLRCLDEFRGGLSLWPEYDHGSLTWLVSFMERMGAYGQLRKVALRDDAGKMLGWYIYYRRSGGVSEVVQIGGIREFIKDILDHLFYDARNHGAIAVHGVVDRRLMDDFSDKNCIFTCRGGWMLAHSRKPELLDILDKGDAFLSRLDGEWCLAVS